MKKMTVVLFAMLLLFSTALADVQSQVNAPARYQETLSSPSGRSHIYVDAQVVVPEAETIPIYQVYARAPYETEFRALADVAFGTDGYTLERGVTDAKNPAGFTYQEDDPDRWPEGFHGYSLETSRFPASRLHQGGEGYSVTASYTTSDYVKNVFLWNRLAYYDGGDNFGKKVPPEAEARAAADAIVAQVFPDFRFWGSEEDINGIIDERTGRGMIMDYGYRFYYARMIGNIPVSYVHDQGGGDYYPSTDQTPIQTQMYASVPPYEKLFIDVGENGVFQIQFQNPLRVGEAQGDASFLSFDKIMEIFNRIAPLGIAGSELNSLIGGRYVNNIYIKEIRLGYMCTMDRNHPERYLMIPVWDFYGDREFRGDYEAWNNQSHFTISAIDGTVIDRAYGY